MTEKETVVFTGILEKDYETILQLIDNHNTDAEKRDFEITAPKEAFPGVVINDSELRTRIEKELASGSHLFVLNDWVGTIDFKSEIPRVGAERIIISHKYLIQAEFERMSIKHLATGGNNVGLSSTESRG
jgi:hypothetical protein